MQTSRAWRATPALYLRPCLTSSGIRHFSFQRLLNSGNHWKPLETRKLGHFETYVQFPGNLPWQQATETMETYGNYGNLRNLKTMVAVAMQQLKTNTVRSNCILG